MTQRDEIFFKGSCIVVLSALVGKKMVCGRRLVARVQEGVRFLAMIVNDGADWARLLFRLLAVYVSHVRSRRFWKRHVPFIEPVLVLYTYSETAPRLLGDGSTDEKHGVHGPSGRIENHTSEWRQLWSKHRIARRPSPRTGEPIPLLVEPSSNRACLSKQNDTDRLQCVYVRFRVGAHQVVDYVYDVPPSTSVHRGDGSARTLSSSSPPAQTNRLAFPPRGWIDACNRQRSILAHSHTHEYAYGE